MLLLSLLLSPDTSQVALTRCPLGAGRLLSAIANALIAYSWFFNPA